jgi:tetratricopeptide (TPR) repeat protein
MKEYAPGVESSDLSLVAVAATPAAEPEPVAIDLLPVARSPVRAPAAPTSTKLVGDFVPEEIEDSVRSTTAEGTDKYMARAMKEHAAGHVDKTLWARAVAHAGNDRGRAKAIYLQSRATALRVTKREQRAAKYASVVETLKNAPDAGFDLAAQVTDDDKSNGSTETRRLIARRNRRRMILVAAGIGSLAVIGGLVAAVLGSDPASEFNLSAPVRVLNVFNRAPPAAPAVAAPAPANPTEDFVARVQALEKEGNWNVVVLYGVEWTRKQPANPNSWKALSRGYVRLRQYGEALDAANKAVQLGPDDYLQWQNLGQVNIALQLPADALVAFHHATTLNDQDAFSLVQEGVLDVQLGRIPDAKIAFAKALALGPDDVQALCGTASIAQREGRVKDADAIARQVATLSSRCLDSSAGEVVRVVSTGPIPETPKQ